MRFCFDGDRGDVIEGWLVPDNPIAVSRVHVSADGRRLAEIAATGTDDGLRAKGWHATGRCLIRITEENVPGLSSLSRLELHDVATNLLVHRRVPTGTLERRMLLIGTGIGRDVGLETTLFPHFRQSYLGIGRFPNELLTTLFENRALTSCLMSGALAFRRYESHATGAGMLSAILVQDPLTELASRLLWLRERKAVAHDPQQNWRLGPLLDVATFAAGHDYDDAKSLKRLFRSLPEPAFRFLDNPLVRQLSARDRSDPADATEALDVLSRIGIVGHRDHVGVFATMLSERLGIDLAIPAPVPVPAATRALAARLRELDAAQDSVALDEALSAGIARSIARNWGGLRG